MLKYADTDIKNELYKICNGIYLGGKLISDLEKGYSDTNNQEERYTKVRISPHIPPKGDLEMFGEGT